MANKFFGLFDAISETFRDQFDELNAQLSKSFNEKFDVKTDTIGLSFAQQLQEISEFRLQYQREIDEVNQALVDNLSNDDPLQRLRIETELKNERAKIESKQALTEKEYAKLTKKTTDEQLKLNKSFTETFGFQEVLVDIQTKFSGKLDELTKNLIGGKIEVSEFNKAIKELKGVNAAETINAFAQGFSKLGNSDGPIFGALSESFGNLFGPLGEVAEEVFKVAFERMVSLNDILVDLERNSGGVIHAMDTGSDVFGNVASKYRSLTTELAGSNLSVQEYKDALISLTQDGFGQTIGVLQDLNNSAEDLHKFGIEAAQLNKLYGAQIGPGVRALVQNFGKSIGEATDMMKEGAETAKSLGLNVAFYTDNLKKVFDLIGSVYINSAKQQQDLALISTSLGVSIDTLVSGVTSMKGIGDLFTQQQDQLALGLSASAAALGQIYALQKTGNVADASKLQFSMAAIDINAQGGVDRNNMINDSGKQALEAAGFNAEAIAGVQKLILQSERTGVSLMNLGSKALSAEDQFKVMHDEMKNLKLTEQFENIQKSVESTLVDPLVAMLGPATKLFANITESLIEFVGIITRFLMPLFVGIGETLNDLNDMFIIAKLRLMEWWGSITDSDIDYVAEGLRGLGKILGLLVAGGLLFKFFSLIRTGIIAMQSAIVGTSLFGSMSMGAALSLGSMILPILAITAVIALLWGGFKLLNDETEDRIEQEKKLKAQNAKFGSLQKGSGGLYDWNEVIPYVQEANNKKNASPAAGIVKSFYEKQSEKQEKMEQRTQQIMEGKNVPNKPTSSINVKTVVHGLFNSENEIHNINLT